MPTVLLVDGLRVMIFTDDHEPPHVHVFRAGSEAVFFLNCPDGPPSLRDRKGFSFREVNKIEKWLTEYVTALCGDWRRLHGDDD